MPKNFFRFRLVTKGIETFIQSFNKLKYLIINNVQSNYYNTIIKNINVVFYGYNNIH